MSKCATELIFHTLRQLSVHAYRYDKNYQLVARCLLDTIPYNSGNTGGMLYQVVVALESDSLKIKKMFQWLWGCPYELGNSDGWYWLASWASHHTLEYYLKGQ